MKTKLLFIFSFISFVSLAQFTINQGFENPVWPTGWTNDSFSINTTNKCTGSYGSSKQFSQASPFGGFSTSNYTSNGESISFSVNYYVASTGSNPGWNNVSTSYSINNGSWITIFSGTVGQMGANCATINFTIPAGTVPAGALVKFGFGGFRQSNTTVLRFDDILITQLGDYPSVLLANYPFNNSYSDINSANPFSSNAGTSFTTDRHGNPTGAININNWFYCNNSKFTLWNCF